MSGRYLNPLKIKEEAKGGPIKVVVYNNLMFDVVPDPKNQEKCIDAERRYSMGYYVHRNTYFMTNEQYNDKSFWNA